MLEGNQAGLGQQLQASAAVDRVIGDGNAGALGQFVETFVLFRIQADIVDDARRIGHQIKTCRCLGVFQERDVLEVVHVNVAAGQADIRRDPVAELDQLDAQALFFRFTDGRFQRDGERGGSADFQRCVGRLGNPGQAQAQEQGRDRAGKKSLKHAVALQSGWCGDSWRRDGRQATGDGQWQTAFRAGCLVRRRSCRSRDAATRGSPGR
ncbi:hypothetical protein D3C80_1478290 [compost metagenome]